MRHLIAALALALAACASEPSPSSIGSAGEQTIVLSGTITRADPQTYREIPFSVPDGTGRIAVDFTYDKENRTVVDLGMRDPQGQRGWSGGNKSSFHIGWDSSLGLFASSPSYTWGPLTPGEWRLVLGIPNIREGQSSDYTATITLSPIARDAHGEPVYMPYALAADPGWFRGDFHTHTAHSDGSCDMNGQRQPCPTIYTVTAAAEAKLDFVAITDHNTISQLLDITVQQNRQRNLLLIPGTEITTFNGHANVIGNSGFLDFQFGSPRLPTLDKLFDQVEAASSFLSINHPSLPSGEVCMGCGWTVKDTDWSRVTAVEVINGSTLRTAGAEASMSGIRFWEDLLKQGYRITAIGGSDNHDATDTTGARQSPVGTPATVVRATELSTAGIVAGVRSGRVFIDAAGLPDATLDMTTQGGAVMGDKVTLRPGERTAITIDARNTPPGAQVELVGHNLDVTDNHVSLTAGAAAGWVRANVRDADGKLLLLGNPIYFTAAPAG